MSNDSPVDRIEWSQATYSIGEVISQKEHRLPVIALVKSTGPQNKSPLRLTDNVTLSVGQILRIGSLIPAQERAVVEVAPNHLKLNLPIECPIGFDIPQRKKKNVKLRKIGSPSSKYALPLTVEASNRYNEYFGKVTALSTGDAKRRATKMQIQQIREERFLKVNSVDKGAVNPLVMFLSEALPIQLVIAVGCHGDVQSNGGQAMWEEVRKLYQLTPTGSNIPTNVKANNKKKPSKEKQLFIVPGLYVMNEGSVNNNNNSQPNPEIDSQLLAPEVVRRPTGSAGTARENEEAAAAAATANAPPGDSRKNFERGGGGGADVGDSAATEASSTSKISASSSPSSPHRNIVVEEQKEEEENRRVTTNGTSNDEAADIRGDGGGEKGGEGGEGGEEKGGEGVVELGAEDDGLGRRSNRARGLDDDAEEGRGSLDDRHLEDFSSSHLDGDDDVPDSYRTSGVEGETRHEIDRRGSHEGESADVDSHRSRMPSPRQNAKTISEPNDYNDDDDDDDDDDVAEMSLGSTGVFRVELMPQSRAADQNGHLDSDDDDDGESHRSANETQQQRPLNARNRSHVAVTHSGTRNSAGSRTSPDTSGGSEQNAHDPRTQELTQSAWPTNHHKTPAAVLRSTTGGRLDVAEEDDSTERTQRKAAASSAVTPQWRTLVDDEINGRQTDVTKMMTTAGRAKGDASMQTALRSTVGYTSDDDDDDVRTLSPGVGGPSVIELRSHGQNRPGIDSSNIIRREGSIIKRIILNDNDNAVCKITSIRPYEGDRNVSATSLTTSPLSFQRATTFGEHWAAQETNTSSSTLPRTMIRSSAAQTSTLSPARAPPPPPQILHLELPPYSNDSFLTVRRTHDRWGAAVQQQQHQHHHHHHHHQQQQQQHSAVYNITRDNKPPQNIRSVGTVQRNDSWNHGMDGGSRLPFPTTHVTTSQFHRPPQIEYSPDGNFRTARPFVITLAAAERSVGPRNPTEGQSRPAYPRRTNELSYGPTDHEWRREPDRETRNDAAPLIHEETEQRYRRKSKYVEQSSHAKDSKASRGNGEIERSPHSTSRGSDQIDGTTPTQTSEPVQRSRTLEPVRKSRVVGGTPEEERSNHVTRTTTHRNDGVVVDGPSGAKAHRRHHGAVTTTAEQRSRPQLEGNGPFQMDKDVELKKRKAQERNPSQNPPLRSPIIPKESSHQNRPQRNPISPKEGPRQNVPLSSPISLKDDLNQALPLSGTIRPKEGTRVAKNRDPARESADQRSKAYQRPNVNGIPANKPTSETFYFDFEPEVRGVRQTNGHATREAANAEVRPMNHSDSNVRSEKAPAHRSTAAGAERRPADEAKTRKTSDENDRIVVNGKKTKERGHRYTNGEPSPSAGENPKEQRRDGKTPNGNSDQRGGGQLLLFSNGYRSKDAHKNAKRHNVHKDVEEEAIGEDPLTAKRSHSPRQRIAKEKASIGTRLDISTDDHLSHPKTKFETANSGDARAIGDLVNGHSSSQTRTRKKRNREIAADSELIYPVDSTVRETIRNLDSYLKEQDPDAQSIASSQFTTEHHELMVHPQRPELSNF